MTQYKHRKSQDTTLRTTHKTYNTTQPTTTLNKTTQGPITKDLHIVKKTTRTSTNRVVQIHKRQASKTSTETMNRYSNQVNHGDQNHAILLQWHSKQSFKDSTPKRGYARDSKLNLYRNFALARIRPHTNCQGDKYSHSRTCHLLTTVGRVTETKNNHKDSE